MQACSPLSALDRCVRNAHNCRAHCRHKSTHRFFSCWALHPNPNPVHCSATQLKKTRIHPMQAIFTIHPDCRQRNTTEHVAISLHVLTKTQPPNSLGTYKQLPQQQAFLRQNVRDVQNWAKRLPMHIHPLWSSPNTTTVWHTRSYSDANKMQTVLSMRGGIYEAMVEKNRRRQRRLWESARVLQL